MLLGLVILPIPSISFDFVAYLFCLLTLSIAAKYLVAIHYDGQI